VFALIAERTNNSNLFRGFIVLKILISESHKLRSLLATDCDSYVCEIIVDVSTGVDRLKDILVGRIRKGIREVMSRGIAGSETRLELPDTGSIRCTTGRIMNRARGVDIQKNSSTKTDDLQKIKVLSKPNNLWKSTREG